MIKRVTYGEKLDVYANNNNLIPYRLYPKARYRANCYYWIAYEDNWFRVDEVDYMFTIGKRPQLNHIIAEYPENRFSYITTDLTEYDFRLERDKYRIRNVSSIINTDKSYAGGEIEWWFFTHNITFDKEYEKFWRYINPNSMFKLIPNKYYFIYARKYRGKYIDVQIIPDGDKMKFMRGEEK